MPLTLYTSTVLTSYGFVSNKKMFKIFKTHLDTKQWLQIKSSIHDRRTVPNTKNFNKRRMGLDG